VCSQGSKEMQTFCNKIEEEEKTRLTTGGDVVL
jgi:hypothetical protein